MNLYILLKYGSLKPSDNFTVTGKIEKMMKTVGCYVRYDYSLEGVKYNNKTYKPDEDIDQDTIDSCATECFQSRNCSAWSFQMATKRCLLFNQGHVNTTMLSPSKTMSSMQENARNLGWASGNTACNNGI